MSTKSSRSKLIECGIYTIEINEKIYIGSSIDIDRRWREHKLKLSKKTHPNKKLLNAWNKYGQADYCIVELCDESTLLKREQFWIDELSCVQYGLNICAVAGNTLGRQHTDEAKEKISKVMKENGSQKGNQHFAGYTHTEESKAKMSKALKGRQFSDEHKAKISEASKGNKSFLGKQHSDETKQKMKDAWARRKAQANTLNEDINVN